MKKIVWISLFAIALTVGILWWDYSHNDRISYARLHTVSVGSYQEQMEFSAPVIQVENRFLMSGAVRKIDNITVGAIATVTVENQTYEGSLCRLEPTLDGICYATVLVEGLTTVPKENATAVILGNLRQNVIFVPQECLVTDEAGQPAVFVVKEGYSMLRRVQPGHLSQTGQTHIEQGLFPQEQLIVSPEKIRSGDRIFPQ